MRMCMLRLCSVFLEEEEDEGERVRSMCEAGRT